MYDIPRVLWQNYKHHPFEFLAVVGLNDVRVLVNAREDLKFLKEIANVKMNRPLKNHLVSIRKMVLSSYICRVKLKDNSQYVFQAKALIRLC